MSTNSAPRRKSWELQLTQQELEQLRRERQHLLSKAIERPLSSWEKLRKQEIFQEAKALLKRAREIAREQFPQSRGRLEEQHFVH
jgi:thioesterase domain-containing protein